MRRAWDHPKVFGRRFRNPPSHLRVSRTQKKFHRKSYGTRRGDLTLAHCNLKRSRRYIKFIEEKPRQGSRHCLERFGDFYRLFGAVNGPESTGSRPRHRRDRLLDVIEASRKHVSLGCVVDGEAVIWTANRLDFNALRKRRSTSRAVPPAQAVALLPDGRWRSVGAGLPSLAAKNSQTPWLHWPP
jgi:hypothetical protein